MSAESMEFKVSTGDVKVVFGGQQTQRSRERVKRRVRMVMERESDR